MQSVVSEDKISANTQLLFDRAGVAHALTAIENADGMSAGLKLAAYMECASDCTSPDAWNGVGLSQLYDSIVEEIKPSLALALTKEGHPRVLFLERGGPNNKRLLYFECDGQCTEDNWTGSALSDLSQLGSGVDLVLDAQDHPRFVFTLDYNIGLYSCDSPSCAQDDSKWELTKVEFSSDLPKDSIILWPNCTVDAWILHKPSLSLARNGAVHVGYRGGDGGGGRGGVGSEMEMEMGFLRGRNGIFILLCRTMFDLCITAFNKIAQEKMAKDKSIFRPNSSKLYLIIV